MDRLAAFNLLREHYWYSRLFKRLKKAEVEACRDFIKNNEALSSDDFHLAVSRWNVDKSKEFRNETTMNELVMVAASTSNNPLHP